MAGVAANDFKSLLGIASLAGMSTAAPSFEPNGNITPSVSTSAPHLLNLFF